MTAPAPKPMPQLDELRVRLGDLLEDARKLFQYPEKRRLTILVRQAGESERDCVVTDDTPEGVLEIVSRRFPNGRPNPETQAVAYRYKLQQETYWQHGEGLPSDDFVDFCRRSTRKLELLYRSPVESVPVEKLRELGAEWRNENAATGIAKPIAAAIRRECADRLSAIVKEYSK